MTVYLSLGSNLGDRMAFLRSSVARLMGQGTGSGIVCSSVYETAPQDVPDQPPFLNLCLRMECSESPPESLLQQLSALENAVGRKSAIRFGPREIDIDILLIDNLVREQPPILPHPRLMQRAFVLVPLLEIAPNLTLPDGSRAADYLPAVANQPVRFFGALGELYTIL